MLNCIQLIPRQIVEMPKITISEIYLTHENMGQFLNHVSLARNPEIWNWITCSSSTPKGTVKSQQKNLYLLPPVQLQLPFSFI